jgi:formiminotetrahydrofolate cyclodeaminase
VRINLGGIKDEAFVQDMEDKCKALETQANQQEAAARSILDMR